MPQIAAIKSDAVTLTWRAPSEDGGSAITGYVIEYRIEGGFKWLLANDTDTVTQPKYTVRHLKENMEYEFRVAAVNKAGVGDYAQCATPITVREPVGTCRSVSVKYLFDKSHFFCNQSTTRPFRSLFNTTPIFPYIFSLLGVYTVPLGIFHHTVL